MSPASDLYSLGLVLFEMLTGRRFIQGTSETEILASAMNPQLPEIPWLCAEINDYLSHIITANPQERFGSASAAMAVLDGLPLPEHSALDTTRFLFGLITSDVKGSTGAIATAEPAAGMEQSESSAPSQTGLASVASRERRRLYRRVWIGGIALLVVVTATVGVIRWMQRTAGVTESSAIIVGNELSSSRQGASSGTPMLKEKAQRDKGIAEDEVVMQLQGTPPELTISADDLDMEARAEMETLDEDATQNRQIMQALAQKNMGRLRVFARPWAYVHVDGVLMGTTPLRNHALPVGEHSLRIVNRDLGFDKERIIVIRRGTTVNIHEQVDIGQKANGKH
ncbi:MAG: PEGA domain-containing protein [Deltaproteobacteria bacterium]|nr:PEGA domain-containing protein [Deltaproteobacteria bacterium]